MGGYNAVCEILSLARPAIVVPSRVVDIARVDQPGSVPRTCHRWRPTRPLRGTSNAASSGIGLSQATVSHHLKKLTDAGLLEREQRGKWAYYTLSRDALERLLGAPIASRGWRTMNRHLSSWAAIATAYRSAPRELPEKSTLSRSPLTRPNQTSFPSTPRNLLCTRWRPSPSDCGRQSGSHAPRVGSGHARDATVRCSAGPGGEPRRQHGRRCSSAHAPTLVSATSARRPACCADATSPSTKKS